MNARKSTNINELPSLNSLANQNDEEDAIAEVLEEIQNENNAENFGPRPPLETMPQGPSQNNIPTPMRHPTQIHQQNQNIAMPPQMVQTTQNRNIANNVSQQMMPINTSPPNVMFQNNQQQMQENVLNELKTQLLAENFVDKKQKTYDNRILKFIDDVRANSSLILLIFVSQILLQNEKIKNLVLSKFQRFNLPYLNFVLLGMIQVIIVIGVKNFF